jgi:parvulin-like peptidyl-prolyl isomerase
MTRTRLSLATLLVVAALGAAGCGGGGGGSSNSSSSGGGGSSNGVPTGSVATVAGKTISRAALDDLMKSAQPQYKDRTGQDFPKPGTAEYQALQQQAAVYLVTHEEYAQDAAKRGIAITQAQVTKALGDLIKKNFSGDRKKFDAYLKSEGYTLQQFDTSIREELLEKALAADVTRGVKVSDAEVKAYYDKNKGSSPYTTPAQRRVRHILVALNKDGKGVSDSGVKDTTVDFPKSKALADSLYARLRKGADFAALAKQYSQDPGSKDKGGEYTDVKGTFVKPFEDSAFSLDTHELSKPVKSEFGYHLIEALAPTKPGKTQTLAQATKAIRKTLLDQKRNSALQAWSNQLATTYKGKVKYAAGFEPPATTTPTTTTATTP